MSGFIVEEFAPVVRNTLRGFCRVRMPSGMVLHDVAIHMKDGSAWAAPASKPMIGRDGIVMRDAEGKIQYAPVVTFANKGLRGRFSDQVTAALRERYPDALDATS
jgi:hypothetical protein